MKAKQTWKMGIDAGMTLLLFVLMAYQLTGQIVHEWVGAAMFLLFIAHHILNHKWAGNLLRGRYTLQRTLLTVLDLLLVVDMLVLMVSALQLSRYVFSFLPVFGSPSQARRLHLLASYWGFVLMGLHLGLHWGMVTGLFRKITGYRLGNFTWPYGGIIALYGAYAFWNHQIWTYLFLQSEFAFFDATWPTVLYFLDHGAMLGLFVLLGHGAAYLLRKRKTEAK